MKGQVLLINFGDVRSNYLLMVCGTIMVLNHIDTSNNYLYNMNTKIREKAVEILQSHISFGEFE